jgi:hypothetical protein
MEGNHNQINSIQKIIFSNAEKKVEANASSVEVGPV